MRRAAAGGVTLLAAVGLTGCGPRWQGELVSVNAAGTGSGDWGSNLYTVAGPVVSPDGTKVAFNSRATNLGATDTNNQGDVSVRDLVAGTTSLVSVNAAGTDAGRYGAGYPVFSPDSTKVAFISQSDDLGPVDGNRAYDVYVRDLATGSTTLVSTDAAGTDSGDAQSLYPVFSPDGSTIAFQSDASNLGSVDGNGTTDIYVHDVASGTNRLVSTNGAGTDGANNASDHPTFSPDGTTIAFHSLASDLGPVDGNNTTDIYVHDVGTGANTLLATNSAGTGSGNGYTGSPSFGPDGTKVAFVSGSTDLVAGDTNPSSDVYLRDLVTGGITVVSANLAGTNGGSWGSAHPVFSPDGTRIAFSSSAPDLVATDTNRADDVFVWDLATRTTRLVSVNAAGTDSGTGRQLPESGYSKAPVFSADGKQIAFESQAVDLGPKDTLMCPYIPVPPVMRSCQDIYVRNLETDKTSLVSATADGRDSGNADSVDPHFLPDGRSIVFTSAASNFGPPDSNGADDVYIARVVEPTS